MIDVLVIANGMIRSMIFSRCSIERTCALAMKQSSPVTRSHSTISGQVAQNVGDVRELAGQGPHPQPGGDRQSDPRRVDPDRITFDHAAFLEPPYAFGYARRGEADHPGDVCDADACVLGQRLEDARVDSVDGAVFISKAFHRYGLC